VRRRGPDAGEYHADDALKATQISDTSLGDAPVSTATGVYLYVAMAGLLFVLAAVPAITLARVRA
jgi:hypothetical protein